jgi:hypothetical protein
LFRVFHREAFYRRRGIVRRRPGGSHHRGARPGAGLCPLMVRLAPGPPGSCSVFGPLPKKKTSRTCLVQFREYFLCSISETQIQQETGNWHCGILSIG